MKLWNKRTLFTLAVLSFARIAQAESIQCPQFPSLTMKQHALTDASLFVGPPKEQVELMPDTDKDTAWTLADYQDEARQHKTSLYVVCRYKNTLQTVELVVPATAQKCSASYDQHNNLIAHCQ
ncbi:STY0301 family protein [Kosakonia sp.]|uniref:STY0301 family protein n=1 Tax=Kosakonia sp. TaxID=1916651 RepID=UPI0028A6FEB0|nr:STY0301 family protein [Kosakonia sp.]